jgi:predicted acyltransferase
MLQRVNLFCARLPDCVDSGRDSAALPTRFDSRLVLSLARRANKIASGQQIKSRLSHSLALGTNTSVRLRVNWSDPPNLFFCSRFSVASEDLSVVPPPRRVVAIDAYRGFVMLLLMAEVLRFGAVARAIKALKEGGAASIQDWQVAFWDFLAKQQSHVAWAGCNLHDLIQPSFSFLVGASLPFSLAARLERGQSKLVMTLHALWRSFLLIALGIFLRSLGSARTNYTFEDTLTQIGLGYFFLYLIGLAGPRFWWAAFFVIVVGYYAAFAWYPAPPADFDYPAVGVPNNWPEHYTGFASHWNKNSNLAWKVDQWFLNLFPSAKPPRDGVRPKFVYNGGGYSTLSFVPTLATMILGLIAGGWLRQPVSTGRKLSQFTVAGLLFLALGFGLDYFGICPNVKRIWTPSWVLFSGGWCLLIMAGFFSLLDAVGWKRWAFPLYVIGANSIAAYFMAEVWQGFFSKALRTHIGEDFFKQWGEAYAPLFLGFGVLLCYWLILLWMYRRKVFIRI